jgi:hypothetical protein
MPDITLCRYPGEQLSVDERLAVEKVLLQKIHGFTDDDKKSWKRFVKSMMQAEEGELFEVKTRFMRNPRFHRKMFALFKLGFDSWEPDRVRQRYKGMPVQKNFDRFRKDVTIAAGFYDQTFSLKGKMELEAISLSFANMDDAEFEKVYSAVLDVLLQGVLVRYGNRKTVNEVIEQMMRFA